MLDRPRAPLPTGDPASPTASDADGTDTTSRPRRRRVWVVLVSVLAAFAVVGATIVAALVVTEGRRFMAAQDIDDVLGAVPGVTDADVTYSYAPFSTGRVFDVVLHIGPDADTAPVSDALAASQHLWQDSPLEDDAVSTSVAVIITDEAAQAADPSAAKATLTFYGWDLSEVETVHQVAYWSMLRETLGPVVSVRVTAYDGETDSWLDADLSPVPPATAMTATDLAERVEEAASADPPAGGWTWSVRTPTVSGDGALQSSIDTHDGRPDSRVLTLWRGAAALASSRSPAPQLWLRSDLTNPGPTLLVTFPDGEEPDGSEPPGETFVDGPHWADATGYSELVAAAGADARLWIQVGHTAVADLSAASCTAAASPSEGVVEAALLDHLRGTGADFC